MFAAGIIKGKKEFWEGTELLISESNFQQETTSYTDLKKNKKMILTAPEYYTLNPIQLIAQGPMDNWHLHADGLVIWQKRTLPNHGNKILQNKLEAPVQ